MLQVSQVDYYVTTTCVYSPRHPTPKLTAMPVAWEILEYSAGKPTQPNKGRKAAVIDY
ncbi:hypothetical protein PILCRDRAFT_455315 [Piloderma croceum F 1598]|uniref:Uncharacterized protein n=1 Tax=Piloderma croceum (strain F 1598) TaxID=765440 RepID=A0A0C3FE99_PILCF|nr:hypothetical protein PILCRDRAFT_455315 [Piloderma croceum F 1598]